jgi:ribosomal protein S18 acetylase RimI-like enzyme
VEPDVLDQCAWHALSGPQARFAQWSDDRRAVRVDPEVSVFAAADDFEADAWASLRDLVGDGYAVLVAPERPPMPAGVEVEFEVAVAQMVAVDATELPAPPTDGVRIEPLGRDDVPAMLELVELTSPGPFRARTLELGGYVGVRENGRLIAMAGERMHPPGAAEVSAVCTHPDFQGRGLGAALTTHVARGIRGRREVPFLHVTVSNPARRLYRALGFVERTELLVLGIRFS